jgi:flavin-dependent dehydrogenase
VEVRAETAVAGLTGRPGERISGVELADGRRLPAELVVDASGRGSRSDRWLQDLGFPGPSETVITVRVHYTTRLVRGHPTVCRPRHDRAGGEPAGAPAVRVAFPVEGDRWLVTLGGFHGAQAPTDPAGFQRFADSCRPP